MKLVAARDFANVKKLSLKLPADQWAKGKDGKPDTTFIPKGAVFEIGDSDKSGDLAPDDKEKVLNLFNAGCIVGADDTASVKRIQAEVVIERARVERSAKHQLSLEELVAAAVAKAVTEALAAQSAGKK